MNHIVMLLSNPFRPDPRVAKEALTLGEHDYKLTIVCWDRMAEMDPYLKLSDNIEVVRIQNVRSSYGVGIKQLFRLPLFWRNAIRNTIPLKPEIVHCHDLDTLYIGWKLKRLIGCKLIFDAHEDYPALMGLHLPKPATYLLTLWERFLLNKVDYLISVSPSIVEKYSAYTTCPAQTIRNFQSIESYNEITPEKIAEARLSIGLKPEDYVVAYIGGFSKNRLLIPLIEAVSEIPDVKLILWGDGHQKIAIQEAISLIPNISYLGWAPANFVPLFTSLADVIYYCLIPNYPYSTPNTLSNAMLAGRPILASRVGDLGQIIEQTCCGILLEEVTAQSIRSKIELLRDPTLRNQLGQAGRIAAENKYNWEFEAQKLLTIYESLS